MKRFPFVSDEFLKALEEAFPDKAPRKEPSMFDVGATAGEQRVLDFIRKHHSKQNILEG